MQKQELNGGDKKECLNQRKKKDAYKWQGGRREKGMSIHLKKEENMLNLQDGGVGGVHGSEKKNGGIGKGGEQETKKKKKKNGF